MRRSGSPKADSEPIQQSLDIGDRRLLGLAKVAAAVPGLVNDVSCDKRRR